VGRFVQVETKKMAISAAGKIVPIRTRGHAMLGTMAELRETQLRLVYSLLKPALRMAARFRVPIRSLTELVRVAYFEALSRGGLSQAEIGRRLGQTERNVRSLAQRLRTDFFAAEQTIGLMRTVENRIASSPCDIEELVRAMCNEPRTDVEGAVEELIAEGRITCDEAGILRTAAAYVLLRSDQFHRRVDALNHFLDGVYRALVHRLLFDEKQNAMLKMITFKADPDALHELITQVEGQVRTAIARLEEDAQYGAVEQRFMFGLALAPLREPE
jgi:hypothetical protein